jgi:hypothetical protein
VNEVYYMNINCYFCSTELEHHGGGIFKCFVCPHMVTYICSGSSAKIHVRTVDIVLNPYVISLEQDSKHCVLYEYFQLGGDWPDRILFLNYLPEITPDNAIQWIERFLKLRAFS